LGESGALNNNGGNQGGTYNNNSGNQDGDYNGGGNSGQPQGDYQGQQQPQGGNGGQQQQSGTGGQPQSGGSQQTGNAGDKTACVASCNKQCMNDFVPGSAKQKNCSGRCGRICR
jgi:translation initiation factor IF-2